MSERKFRITRDFASSVLTTAAAALALLVAAYILGLDKIAGADLTHFRNSYQQGQIDFLGDKVAEVTVKQEELEKALTRPPADLQTRLLVQRLDAIEQRQARIEQAIMDNPQKAVEVPMLRNDLNNLKQSDEANLAAIKSSVDQVYDLNKWLLGAMALAIVGLAISRLLTTNRE